MTLAFCDEEFLKVCKELDEPQVDGWEFFVESHGVTIYRLYDEVGVYVILCTLQTLKWSETQA